MCGNHKHSDRNESNVGGQKSCSCRDADARCARTDFDLHHPFRRILVAVDDGEPAKAAIHVAGRLATALGSQVKFVHVVTPSELTAQDSRFPQTAIALRRAHAYGLLRRARRELPRGVQGLQEVLEGDAAAQIHKTAADWNARLIIIGVHGRGRLSDLLLGSTARAVTEGAPCPVLTVGPQHLDRVLSFLSDQRVQYSVIAHDMTGPASDAARAAHVSAAEFAKTLLVKIDGDFALALIAADRQLDLEALRRSCGAKSAELASEHELKLQFPDCETGAMPPFGDLYGLDVYVDLPLSHKRVICFNAGTHDEVIEMPYGELRRLARTFIVDISQQTSTPHKPESNEVLQ